ncbi:hypothetical protein DYB37_009279 [Aphanomyces astaci]|uniref:Cytochrome b561 domain-containing protein n=1 Tax=Aphanomyces astaci TaxID=112090 RepID=A0A418FRU6_APHAT|nr:hypothetical protein DYB37_009279 [Aphanomyces astaci]
MSCFFLLMAIVSALSDRGFNNCCCLWCFQLPLYGALFVGAYAISNGSFLLVSSTTTTVVTFEDGPGLLPPSILSLYIAFLCYESVSANPNAAGKQNASDGSDVPSWQFHLIMVVGAMYMAMVLTQWDTASGHEDGAAMWVHITSQWVSIAVYMWTLVAPYLVPDREFR